MNRHWPSESTHPVEGKNVWRVGLRVLYSCAAMCQMTREQPSGDMDARAACRCSLPGFDPSRWNPAALPGAADEADQLLTELTAGAEHQGIALAWDLDTMGCPRGWADSEFGASVAKYSSPRGFDSPMRSPNVRLLGRILRDVEPPERLLEHVRYLEAVEDQAYNRIAEIRNSR